MLERFYKDKHLFVGFFLIVGIAVIVILFTRTHRFQNNHSDVSSDDAPLHYMINFRSIQMNAEGEPLRWLLADHMNHYVDNVTRFTNPILRVRQADDLVWEITADQGIINNEEIVQLIKNVHIYRESRDADGNIHILATDFTLNLMTNVGQTETDVVVINPPHSIVSAQGMEVHIDSQVLRLLSRVRGWYIGT